MPEPLLAELMDDVRIVKRVGLLEQLEPPSSRCHMGLLWTKRYLLTLGRFHFVCAGATNLPTSPRSGATLNLASTSS